MTLTITRTLPPVSEQIDAVRQGLIAHNHTQVPALANQPKQSFNVVLREDDEIVAGAVCELKWDYLYVDTLWTDERVRGLGYGSRVMHAAEHFALEHGIHRAYLMTTSFQARPFYEKLGYRAGTEQIDRPRQHTLYVMIKDDIIALDTDKAAVIESPPIDASTQHLEQGLLADIAKTVPIGFDTVAVLLQDSDNTVVGGMVGSFYWDWLDLHCAWVAPAYQRAGWGSKLLANITDLARERDAVGIVTDRADFQTPDFFAQHGYTSLVTLAENPKGHMRTFVELRF
ncbi:MAG: GNAT family N-acetyltransferase [Chloroflexota bacterium]